MTTGLNRKVVMLVLLFGLTLNGSYSADTPKISSRSLDCLTENLYHEARGEGLIGMQAVAQVVINRTKDARWPQAICDVIFQPYQFSWTTGAKRATLPSRLDHLQARLVAWQALANPDGGRHVVGNAVYFHTTQIPKPLWAKRKRVVVIIRNHIFYEG